MQNKKISILVLTSTFPRNINDWWGRFVFDLYTNMSKVDIVIVAPHAPEAKHSEVMQNIRVVRFPYFYPFHKQILSSGSGVLHSSKFNIFYLIQLIIYPISQLIIMVTELLRNDFDIIHVHWIIPQGVNGLIGKLLFKKKLIVTIHGTDIFALKKFNFLKKIILKNCNLCTVNSTETYNAVKKISPNTKIAIIPMGVDTKLFCPKQKKKSNSVIILGVGRLIKWKGFNYLITAFKKLIKDYPNAQLILVGSGPEKCNLKKISGKSIVFYGPCDRKSLAQIYSSADLFVSPSIHNKKTGEREAQGLVIGEALASGIPVVATNTGGIPDIIKDKTTGLLAQEKNSEDLYKKMKQLMNKKILREKCIENGRKLILEKYTWRKITGEFEKIYSSLATTV